MCTRVASPGDPGSPIVDEYDQFLPEERYNAQSELTAVVERGVNALDFQL